MFNFYFILFYFILFYFIFFFLLKKLKFGPKSDFQAFCPVIKNEKTFPWYMLLDHVDGFGKFLQFYLSKNISFILLKRK